MKRQKAQLLWENLLWNYPGRKQAQKTSNLHDNNIVFSPTPPPRPKDVKSNLLKLILWVIAHWPWLNGNDLTFRLTLFPGATSCGGRRFLSFLLPEELLKCFEFGFFLSCAEGMHVSAYQARVRHARERGRAASCPCASAFIPEESFYHTEVQEVHSTPFLHTWKQIFTSVYFGHLIKEPRKLWSMITESKHKQFSSHLKSSFNLWNTQSKAKSPDEVKTMS